MFRTTVLFAATSLVAAYQCPGSAGVHAECQVTALVNGNCSVVGEEMTLRLKGSGGWVDPHNGGDYTLDSFDGKTLHGRRTTGKAPHYLDLFTVQFDAQGDSCQLTACSRSQATSVLDYSTNFCNVHNLYCGTDVKCKPVKYNLSSRESFGTCLQHDATQCVV